MSTYLKYINPVIALVIFLLCFYSSATDEGHFSLDQVYEGSIATYFFAKGIFCGVAIFLLGKMLEVLLRNADSADSN